MKIITSTLIAVATIGAALGATDASKSASSTTNSFVTGFYAGAELGYIHEGHSYKENRFGNLYDDDQTFASKGNKKSDSFLPGLFAGYRHAVGPVFFGFELSANLNNSKSKSTFMGAVNDKTTHSYKAKYNIIPAFVFGAPICTVDGLNIYAKLGCDIGKYNHKTNEYLDGVHTNSASSSKAVRRVLIALGTEYAINKTISTRFEVSHSFGKSTKFKMAGKLPGDNTYNTSLKTRTTAVKLGVFFKI